MGRRSSLVALAALVLVAFATAARSQSGERKITIDEVPAKVKAAILKEVGDGRPVDIGTWKEEGAPRFEIEMARCTTSSSMRTGRCSGSRSRASSPSAGGGHGFAGRRRLKCQEENPLDGEREFEIHAPGIGLVQDEDLVLLKSGSVGRWVSRPAGP